jgi:hypothetical protein
MSWPFDGVTPGGSLHRFIPLSHCEVCGGAAAFPKVNEKSIRPSSEDLPEHVLAALAGWVDRRTGVISRIIVDELTDGVELPVIAATTPPHILTENGSFRCLPIGWGKGLMLSSAILPAVGEAI